MGGFAWVTLATNDSYSLGALVLAHSLKRVGTQHDLAVLVTPGVTGPMREKLGAVFNIVREVNVLDSKDEANLAVLQRPELGITFTKLHCWRLTEYEKCVFVDADALVMKNSDELFEREELSAAPDVGWPDCFNSGVFVFKPSQETFASLTAFAVSKGSFDGADQGLLNMYFSDWAHKDISKHLPFIYNMCSTATYSYAPAFKQFGENVKIIHFIGTTKPWLQYFDTLTGIVQPPTGCSHLQPLLQVWWNIFCDNVHPQLTEVMVASNLTTLWHNYQSLFLHSNIYKYFSHVYNLDSDRLQWGPPDFSEFKDPWENYTEQTDPFLRNNKQCHRDNNLVYHEPYRLASQNQCGAEPPPTESSFHIPLELDQSSQDYTCDHHVAKSQNSTAHNFTHSSQDLSLHDNFSNQNCNDSHDKNLTDTFPNSSPHTSNPNNVTTQLSASPCIENANGGLAGALSKLTLGESRTDEQQAIEDHMRKQNWEQGHIDFMGRDSFDNILKKINETLSTPPKRQPSPVKETRQPEKSDGKSSEVEAAVEECEVALPGTFKSKEVQSTTRKIGDKKSKHKKHSK